MKKITFLIFCLFAFNVNAIEKKTTFTEEIFKQAQSDGTVVVINSWNKYCGTCANGVFIILLSKYSLYFSDTSISLIP